MSHSVVLARCCWFALFFSAWPIYAQPASEAAREPVRKLAFGSCARQDKPQPIWDAIVALRPDGFIFLGDNIYADTEDMELMKAKYAKLAAQPGYQKLKALCPVYATWDDHDYGQNDAGAEYPKKKESQQLFLDFFEVPSDSPRRRQEGVYSATVVGPPGKRVQVIMLDTRYFRSPLKRKSPPGPRDLGPYTASEDPNATMLGAAQWQWLEEQLKIPADLRIIGSSIQLVAEDHGWEKWMNLPHEREKLFRLLKETKAGGVIFLSGDRHLAEISMMDGGVGYPIYDVTSSGMTEAFKNHRPHEPNRHRVGTMNFGDNFGLIAIDWEKPDPIVSLQIRDLDGDIRLNQKLRLSTIHPWRTREEAKNPPAEGTVALAELEKHVGKTVTVEFKVLSAGGSGGRIFLNSEPDYRHEANFTVVLERPLQQKLAEARKIEDPRGHFQDKTIRVTGKVDIFQGKPQMKPTEPEHIQVATSPPPR